MSGKRAQKSHFAHREYGPCSGRSRHPDTSLPEAIAGKMPIENVKTKRLKLQDNYIGSKLYIRIISSDKIEYAITNKDIIEKDYLEIENIVLD